MKIIKNIVYLIVLCFMIYSCNSSANKDKLKNNNLKASENFDTIIGKYHFISVKINKRIDKHYYSNMLIMESRSRFVDKEGKDTVGYFRLEKNKIFYLSRRYKYLQYKNLITSYHNYLDMHEQLFFDFSLNEGEIVFFIGEQPFVRNNTFQIISKKYDSNYIDTIFTCLRIDSLSTSNQFNNGYYMKEMKIGKKVGFTEFKFKDTGKDTIDVYIPKMDSSWKIF